MGTTTLSRPEQSPSTDSIHQNDQACPELPVLNLLQLQSTTIIKGWEPLLLFLLVSGRRAAPRPVVRRSGVRPTFGRLEVTVGAPADPERTTVAGLLLALGLARLVVWLDGDNAAAAITALQSVPGDEARCRGRYAGRWRRPRRRGGERVPGRHAEPAVHRPVLAARRRFAVHKRAGVWFTTVEEPAAR